MEEIIRFANAKWKLQRESLEEITHTVSAYVCDASTGGAFIYKFSAPDMETARRWAEKMSYEFSV